MNVKKYKKEEQLLGYLFVAPLFVGYIMFTLGPLLGGIAMSFTDWSMLNKITSFVGIKNYVDFFNSTHSYKIIINTFYYTTGVVVLNLALALALACLLNRRIFGIGFFRLAVFTPILTTVVVWSLVWKLLLSSNGFINQLLAIFGINGPSWLFNTKTSMISVIIVSVLKGVGMNMFIILGALQNVPELYYEAAKIEGATKWKMFIHITIPMISGTLFACFIVTVIGAFKSFGMIYVMTQGGPMNSTSVWAYDIYLQAFKSLQIGSASASATIMFLVLVTFSTIQWKFRGRWDYNEH